jgi:protocatechuate 3,4-dioxygenase beta subunit
MAELVGRVVLAPKRTPVVGAIVKLWTDSAAGAGPWGRTAATGEDGVFRFPGCKPGSYRAEAQVADLGWRNASTTLAAGAGADFGDIVFGDGGVLEGRALGSNGPLARSTAFACRRVGDLRMSVLTDDDGNYRFGDLVPGRYVVGVGLDGSRGLYGPFVVVEAGKTARCDVGPPAHLAGRVTLDGAAVADGRVSVTRTDGVTTSAEFHDGAFRLEKLWTGDATVQVRLAGGRATPARNVTLVAGENALDVDVKAGDVIAVPELSPLLHEARFPGGSAQIHGRVFATATGKPLLRTDVQLELHVLDEDGGDIGFVCVGDTASDGQFTFRNLQPGRRRIVARSVAGNLREKTVDVNVAEGAKVENVEVALEPLPTGKVIFTVKDQEGHAIAGVPVSFWDITNIDMRSSEPVTCAAWTVGSQNGVFERNYEPGRRVVRIWTGQTGSDGKSTIDRETDVTFDVVEGKTTDVEVVLHPKK